MTRAPLRKGALNYVIGIIHYSPATGALGALGSAGADCAAGVSKIEVALGAADL